MKRGMGDKVNWREASTAQNLSRQMEPPILMVANESGILSPILWGKAFGEEGCMR
jgi:hypothetical protein